MRPVLLAAFGAFAGGAVGAAVGFVAGMSAFEEADGCIEGVCGPYSVMVAIAGLFFGAVFGAVLAIRLSGPGLRLPTDPNV